ncbi:predicted protein [Sclerotinia sclerotiorum 1980 UF-70]|uniref:Uncharacterized protein n=2 Tax=Sclerotinia sclerotiorum (strain ATCC 18683 / 1980 / Ss-1) TaxID=665079 RepID=A7F7A9_SCLS1|nr:predicted protein [Sclerotinia sclerotiorum 1980 UF-70]APA15537.1 hypothetical protein sscle_15g103070 [Sclerotinia sclerotiorum 1980 UF-70]EDN98630.1 predicted protein [Sclerotinia sclerotiorum 1980 UF-70]
MYENFSNITKTRKDMYKSPKTRLIASRFTAEGNGVEAPVVKLHVDIENMPTVRQKIWTDKVMAGNTSVSESTLFKMYKLFPNTFALK